MLGTGDDLDYTPEVKSTKVVLKETGDLSSRILDTIGLRGRTGGSGPAVHQCTGMDFDKFYRVNHPWSFLGVPVPKMQEAMRRLKRELPEQGWEIVSYGPDSSKAKSLELMANHTKKRFSLSITLQDRRGRSENPSQMEVTVASACNQVPKGEKVSDWFRPE
ncbi:hypothetical protein ACIBI4_03615 [Streptomyces sp. NPDC050418]|uniref:hypothetical protein n=1 Tax=Streptomyces sp. NPDC050418 TaxID=3365612 RepID=UPI0037AD9B72